MEQRWRYQRKDGTPIWLAFDPEFRCIYCEEPVKLLSMGGPAVCCPCDCGNSRKTGKKWSSSEYSMLLHNARRRIEDMSADPVWAEYEVAHLTKAR